MIVPWKHQPRYGVEESYKIGMKWLEPCELVEDWGCALCHAKKYRVGKYRGIDGTAGKADLIADLSTYRSLVDGVFMRHILEHNRDWRVILDNALASFGRRMSLILFRGFAEEDRVIESKVDGHIDIDLCERDFMAKVSPLVKQKVVIERGGGKKDTLFLLEGPSEGRGLHVIQS